MATLTNVGGSGGGKGFVLFALVFALVIGVVFFGLLSGNMPAQNTTQEHDSGSMVVGGRGQLSEADVELHTTDFTQYELNDWMNGVAQYNVDVYIRTGHAAEEHSAEEMNAALRCANEYGTISVISENFSRRLHLLCRDPENGREFVVIIQKIRKAIDNFSNATSELVTAFELKSGIQSNIAAYIQGEVNLKQTGILVRLAFKAGELFFSPYK